MRLHVPWVCINFTGYLSIDSPNLVRRKQVPYHNKASAANRVAQVLARTWIQKVCTRNVPNAVVDLPQPCAMAVAWQTLLLAVEVMGHWQ